MTADQPAGIAIPCCWIRGLGNEQLERKSAERSVRDHNEVLLTCNQWFHLAKEYAVEFVCGAEIKPVNGPAAPRPDINPCENRTNQVLDTAHIVKRNHARAFAREQQQSPFEVCHGENQERLIGPKQGSCVLEAKWLRGDKLRISWRRGLNPCSETAEQLL